MLSHMDRQGILYVVATPIGNLGDLTLRAIDVFREVDMIVAESSSRAMKLLNHLEIKKSIITINSFNEERKAKGIVDQLKAGKTYALITGAGTPCISDPGNHIVKRCYEEGVPVKAVPGPSALAGAVSISGLFADRFIFLGFLPMKKGKQKKMLKDLIDLSFPLVFYESPRRIKATLTNLFEILGDRKAVLFREMTKMHEETLRGTLSQLMELFPAGETKGEFTVIIEGKESEKSRKDADN